MAKDPIYAEWASAVEFIYFRSHYGFTGRSKQQGRRKLPWIHVQMSHP